MNSRSISKIVGGSYLIIFVAAVFANFVVIEALLQSPLEAVQENNAMVRMGIVAFLLTAALDTVIAWGLYELYSKHPLSKLSTFFRIMHAVVMGVALFALLQTLSAPSASAILKEVETFNNIWLIGLFFFGIHLILLGRILRKPVIIALFIILAGIMYMVDTLAHFLLADYEKYSTVFLALVAVPSIVGELSLAIYLLVNNGSRTQKKVIG